MGVSDKSSDGPRQCCLSKGWRSNGEHQSSDFETPPPAGGLDALQLRNVAEKSLRNAGELLADAYLLFRHNRWPRALFLSQIASEELAKVYQVSLARVELAFGGLDWSRFWNMYRSHDYKMRHILRLEAEWLSDEPVEELRAVRPLAKAYNQGKMWSLYTDLLGDVVLAPKEIINEAVARNALTIARGRLRLIKTIVMPMIRGRTWGLPDTEFRKANLQAAEKVSETLLRAGVPPEAIEQLKTALRAIEERAIGAKPVP
jgi:AbiV family abortive infection protein